MEDKKNWFWRELEEGYIHVRDRLQFELKSEFITKGGEKDSVFLQELYFYIPDSLLINSQTYSREDFYLDEVNFIRTKTPLFKLKEFVEIDNADSPFFKIRVILFDGEEKELIHELKMFANSFRSTFREEVKQIVEGMERFPVESFEEKILVFCQEVRLARKDFRQLKQEIQDHYEGSKKIQETLNMVEEYMGLVIDNFLAGLIDYFRHHGLQKGTKIDEALCDLILDEGIHPEAKGNEESILQRSSYLNKFFYEALYLKNYRVELKKKHGALIGMLAAGAAMLVYMMLFVWKATTFGINSIPFVLFAVMFYILKDRIKEGMKETYHKNAYRWFPDYSTEILSPKGQPIGVLNESFQFVEKAPEQFNKLRASDPDELLSTEMVMQYKKEIILKTEKAIQLNTIFRFNIHQFLEKAADAVHIRPRLNPVTREIEYEPLPKIYYLTLLLKNSFQETAEIKKFRISIHKQGIEKVQYLGSVIQPLNP